MSRQSSWCGRSARYRPCSAPILEDWKRSVLVLWTADRPLITRRSEVQILPPPLTPSVSRALLRMHNAVTSEFALGRSRLSGLFLGTYSAFAYAALCRVARCEPPARCTFADWRAGRHSLHRAIYGMPYGGALLKVEPDFSTCSWRRARFGPDSTSSERRIGRDTPTAGRTNEGVIL